MKFMSSLWVCRSTKSVSVASTQQDSVEDTHRAVQNTIEVNVVKTQENRPNLDLTQILEPRRLQTKEERDNYRRENYNFPEKKEEEKDHVNEVPETSDDPQETVEVRSYRIGEGAFRGCTSLAPATASS